MTRRTKFPCRHRGCADLVEGPGYCEKHRADGSNWKPDSERGSRQERGYGSEWVRRRERILARDKGLCQPCLRNGVVCAAKQVDHIVSKAEARRRGWAEAQIEADGNLQSICNPCHKTKTATERERVPSR